MPLDEPLSEALVLPALVVAALAAALLLPAAVAGALTAFLVLLAVLALRQTGAGMPRLLLAAAVPALAGLAVTAVLDRLTVDQHAIERRVLLARNAELTAQAIAPGSMLACLDGGAGEAVESSCEKLVFATPQTAAGAVAYVGARLSLLTDAAEFAKRTDPSLLKAFTGTRRAIELDRYGIAAQVLASRDGCTADRCPGFALLQDASALKTHLRDHAFDGYVTRYAAAWNKGEAVADKPPPGPAGAPVSSGYDFPSSASIPPVSIMNAEPKPPKEAATPDGDIPTGSVPGPKATQKPAAKPPAR